MINDLLAGRFIPKLVGAIAQRATGLGSAAVALVEPARFEMSRAGRRFMLASKGVTGQAPVQAWPSTAAQWVIWNGDSTRAYAFEEIGMYLTAGTPGVGGMLLATMFQFPVVTSQVASLFAISASGSNLQSSVLTATAVTMTAAAKGTQSWYAIASNSSPNVTAFAGSTFLEHRNLQGSIILPPSWGLALAVLAPAGTTPLFAPFATWVEIETDLE